MKWGSAKVQGEPVGGDNVDHAFFVNFKEEGESQMVRLGIKNAIAQDQRRVLTSQEFENVDL